MSQVGSHPSEQHDTDTSARLNWLRAGVLGANDGIVSTSGLVIGVAAAGAGQGALLTAGLAGLSAGAMSMAVGEYVSVSTQRDTEQALLAKEADELATDPEAELHELAGIYRSKGLAPDLAVQVAEQLTAHDALAAHAEVELKLVPGELTSPWQAAAASALSFTLGALVPLLAILLLATDRKIPGTVMLAAVALAGVGGICAVTMRGLSGQAALAFAVAVAAASGKQAFDAVVQRDAPDANRGRAFARFESRFQMIWVIGAALPVVIAMGTRLGGAVVAVLSISSTVFYWSATRSVQRGESPRRLPGARVIGRRAWEQSQRLRRQGPGSQEPRS